MNKFTYRLLVALSSLVIVIPATGQKPQYFYLSIGCGKYEQDPAKFKNPAFIAHHNLPEAENSALAMKTLFEKYFSAKGILLSSQTGKMINRQDIFQGINNIIDTIDHYNATNPFLLVYISAHGFLDTVTMEQVTVPADYTRETDVDFHGGAVLNELLHAGELLDSIRLRKLRVNNFPCLVFFDCCRYTEKGFIIKDSVDEAWKIIFNKAAEGVKAFVRTIKDQSNISFVYSANAGHSAITHPWPRLKNISNNLNAGTGIGAICRRSWIIMDKNKGRENFTLHDFLQALQNNSLDATTPPSYLDLAARNRFSSYIIH